MLFRSGRDLDIINIAGKRSSLAYLDQQLLAIPQVRDGAFYMPDGTSVEGLGPVPRLMAFVVAPGVPLSCIHAALRTRIDAAFLPRPLWSVSALPRTSAGKLPRQALAALATSCQSKKLARNMFGSR